MFKKTINELKDLKEIEVEVTAKVDDKSIEKVGKHITKTFAILAGTVVGTSLALHLIDAAFDSKKKSEDD